MGDVVHGAPLGPDRDSLLLGEIVSGENVAPPIRVELIKLVLTLGSLGYLDLEGGHILVEFVVRQCALTQTSLIAHDKNVELVPCKRLFGMRYASDYIQLFCFPSLLLLAQVNMDLYQGSLTTSEKLGDSSHMEDVSSQELRTSETSTGRRKSLPSPHKLFVRLVVLLGLPICGRNRGLSILRLMLAMARQIHPTLPVLWNLVLPQMTLYLNQDQMCHNLEESNLDADSQGNTSFSIKHWQELTLKMLLKSIEQIADEKWTVTLVHEFEQQTSLYEKLPDERGFLYRCLGVTLSKIQHQQTVVEAAELIIQSTNHDSPIEQEVRSSLPIISCTCVLLRGSLIGSIHSAADFVPTLISSSLLATTAMVLLCCRDSGDSADRLTVSKDIEVRPVVQEIAVSGDVQTSTNAEERNVINLWLRLIQIACSDELISAMIKTLVPHLYDPVAHVRYRTLRLCTALLTATLEQLKTVTNGATGLSLSGQLLGHLVARLGDTGCTRRVERSEKRDANWRRRTTLHPICQFAVLSIRRSAPPSVEDEVGMESANLSEPQTLRSDRLLSDLVQHVPMTQIPGLLELIWSGILQCSEEANRTDNADTPERDLSADESAAETTMQSDSVSGLIGSLGLCPSILATTTSSYHTTSSVIPRTEAGYLIRLLIVLLQHRSKHFKEELVGSIIHAVYSLYPNLLIPGLRAGVLLALAELGRNWPVLCLQTISANALPLNLYVVIPFFVVVQFTQQTWSVILAAVAFLPVSRKTNSGPTSLDLTSSPKSLSSEIARTRSLPRLLKHVLHILECCLPYERREVPVDSVQWSTKRDHPNGNSDCPTNKEILSYPVYLDELIHCDHSEHWSLRLCVRQSTLCVKEPVRTKRRLFLRSSGSTTTATTTAVTTNSTTAVAKHRFDSPRSSVAAFTAYLTEPSVFCQVLGYLLLSHATAAGCRTPIGKSYENRSGAEANLERGVQPLIISAEGLYGFLETCGLHPLLRLLTADSSKPMNKVDAHTSREATPNKTEPSQTEHKGLLWNPDLVLEVVEVIGRYVIENLSQAHIFGLVRFFLARLNSAYEPHRMVVTKWLACILSRANGRTVSIVADPLVSEQGSMTAAPASGPVVTPDYLFGQLLSRLEDPCAAVRHIAVTGLGDIGNSVVLGPNSESKSTERSSSEHPAAKLIWRHSVAVTRGLFLILDDKSESDLSMLHDALHSLSYTLPYTNSHRIGPLIEERPSDTTNQARQSLTGRESETVVVKSKVEGSGSEKRLLDFFNNCLRPDLKLHQGEFFNELARLLNCSNCFVPTMQTCVQLQLTQSVVYTGSDCLDARVRHCNPFFQILSVSYSQSTTRPL
ncbi:hypothetical protein FGIG_04859 [Fasciola gigantica]|uniref:MROH2B-like HEAT-repeats domain-containing protein n=1 Tax=Fasciola gigantica TaxID=46835 RepID=A0A504Y6X3_FASGI|nr:hypothetical protein FGIG_04859 [Fasciola gigantica]